MKRLLHNPASPLSHRAVGALAGDADAVVVIDVVEATPDPAELGDLIAALPVDVHDLLDRAGPLYFALGLDDPRWSAGEVLAAAFDNPSLLRCPIVIDADRVRVEADAVEALAGRDARNDHAAAAVLAGRA
jgi:arsenate reductase